MVIVNHKAAGPLCNDIDDNQLGNENVLEIVSLTVLATDQCACCPILWLCKFVPIIQ